MSEEINLTTNDGHIYSMLYALCRNPCEIIM